LPMEARRFKFAGRSPAAGHFSCAAKKSNQKKGAPDSDSRRVEREGAHQGCAIIGRPELVRLLPQTGLRLTSRSRPGSPALRASLRYSTHRAAAELALAIPLRGLRQSSPAPRTRSREAWSGQGRTRPRSQWLPGRNASAPAPALRDTASRPPPGAAALLGGSQGGDLHSPARMRAAPFFLAAPRTSTHP
jgi:hypothetical protein